ncbi:MAG: hypothetical protein M1825_004236, partial [Sarcosagium campestre]
LSVFLFGSWVSAAPAGPQDIALSESTVARRQSRNRDIPPTLPEAPYPVTAQITSRLPSTGRIQVQETKIEVVELREGDCELRISGGAQVEEPNITLPIEVERRYQSWKVIQVKSAMKTYLRNHPGSVESEVLRKYYRIPAHVRTDVRRGNASGSFTFTFVIRRDDWLKYRVQYQPPPALLRNTLLAVLQPLSSTEFVNIP